MGSARASTIDADQSSTRGTGQSHRPISSRIAAISSRETTDGLLICGARTSRRAVQRSDRSTSWEYRRKQGHRQPDPGRVGRARRTVLRPTMQIPGCGRTQSFRTLSAAR
jgi:hypothetical protein